MNAFEIGERLLVEDKLHAPSRLMRARASSCETSCGSDRRGGGGFRPGASSETRIAPVREIIEHGDGGGLLLAVGHLLDVFERVAKSLVMAAI